MERCNEIYENTYKRHQNVHEGLQMYIDARGYDPEYDPYFESEQFKRDVRGKKDIVEDKHE